MATCSILGTWNCVKPGAAFMSTQEWMASNLLILCQLIQSAGGDPSMTTCTVPGLWNQVRGNPPYLSEQEFYAENINLLCQLLALMGGGGVPGSGPVRSSDSAPDTPGDFIGQTYITTNCFGIVVWDGTAWISKQIPSGIYLGLPTIVELKQQDTRTCVPIFASVTGNMSPFDPQRRDYDWNPDLIDPGDDISIVLPDDRAATDPGRWVER